ncbi:unnamed protein product [Adineta ricciae]|uniref:Copine C-terminal domain-containing protein n=1 Tax=Adineta ricciae TaxID=249248 RepID=A0A816CHJ4_ADIRI|nr:unnamed protein product [Adineta ricciae]
MLWPLVYYLFGIFGFILLYEYYQRNIAKQKALLDFLRSLDTLPQGPLTISNKKPFEKIKQEIASYFYFQRLHVIFGVDFSASNEWQGLKTFNGQSLHTTQPKNINPYQKAISQLGLIFEEIFPSKIKYSSFGFGDENTKDYSFFPVVASGEEFDSHQKILDAYLKQTEHVSLSGPTEYTPIIQKLISQGTLSPRDFTMLVIITDELKVSYENKTLVKSLRTLANLPNVCLLVIGVGDGPWGKLSYEEHHIREEVFARIDKKKMPKESTQSKIFYDNFHFVNHNNFLVKQDKLDTENYFGRAVLRKLPTQLKQAYRHDENRTKPQS